MKVYAKLTGRSNQDRELFTFLIMISYLAMAFVSLPMTSLEKAV